MPRREEEEPLSCTHAHPPPSPHRPHLLDTYSLLHSSRYVYTLAFAYMPKLDDMALGQGDDLDDATGLALGSFNGSFGGFGDGDLSAMAAELDRELDDDGFGDDGFGVDEGI